MRWKHFYQPFERARFRFLTVFCLIAAGLMPAAAQATPQRERQALVQAVDAVNVTVGDMDRSTAFYSQVLSFEKVSDTEVSDAGYQQLEAVAGARARVVRMRVGNEFIELTQYLHPSGKPFPADSHSNDLWFQHIAIIVSNMDQAYQRLQQNHVRFISDGPQRIPKWNKEAADIEALYFKDPDGHPLEVLSFPAGKGDPKWHQATKKLFLGIDHTAIAVRDTDVSVKFYRHVLGFHIAGRSLNYGVEQEHLSGIAGARVRITSLHASSGPGIELLEYERPQNGRPLPPGERANDLVHHETTLVTRDIEGAARQLKTLRVRFVSPGIVTHRLGKLGFEQALMVRDPDGHPMKLVMR